MDKVRPPSAPLDDRSARTREPIRWAQQKWITDGAGTVNHYPATSLLEEEQQWDMLVVEKAIRLLFTSCFN